VRLIDTLKRPTRAAKSSPGVTFTTYSDDFDPASLTDFSSYVNHGYLDNGIVFAIQAARKAIIGQASFAFQDGAGELLTAHPEIVRLNRNRRRFFRWSEDDGSLAGNSYWERLPDGNLRRLRPDLVDILWDKETSDVIGYKYWTRGRDVGDWEALRPADVSHYAPMEDPLVPVRGVSWLQPVARKILGDRAVDSHTKSFFENGATVNLVVSYPEKVGGEGLLERQKAFSMGFEGAANAGKTLHIDSGADVKTIGTNFKDMAFRDLSDRNETFICSTGGTPPIIVGTNAGLASSTYSNYGQAFRRWVDVTIRNEWDGQTQALNKLVKAPAGSVLTYDDRRIPALQQDAKDEADIQDANARTIGALIRNGFTPESAVDSIVAKDLTKLEHTGLIPITLTEGDMGLDPEDANKNDPT